MNIKILAARLKNLESRLAIEALISTYYDRFERRDDQWKFVSRRFELHYLTPLKDWAPIAGSEDFKSAFGPD